MKIKLLALAAALSLSSCANTAGSNPEVTGSLLDLANLWANHALEAEYGK